MLKNLRSLLRPNRPTAPGKIDDFSNIPVMTHDELYSHLQIHTKLRSIRRKVAIDPERFEYMYSVPIAKFCEIAQLIPASQAHHHAFPGGLIIHTLSVIEYAIHERQKYTLPLASEPEIIEAQKNLWTYAVFAAALLHDVGKTVTMVNYIDKKKDIPVRTIAGSLLEQHVESYKLYFMPTSFYKLHEKIGLSFLSQIFDTVCRDYLASDLNIFSEVIGYINNDYDNWGSIGEIIRHADQQSAAEDLKIASKTGRKRQFTGAVIENFGERLMRAFRLLINDKQLAINKPGAALFLSSDQKYVYAVSKTIAERLREKMHSMGADDVPTDNTRIFDELQQNGLCESNGSNAIFRIKVTLSNFQQEFTCLKFKTNKLFTVNSLPQQIESEIYEIEKVTCAVDKPQASPSKKGNDIESDEKYHSNDVDITDVTQPVPSDNSSSSESDVKDPESCITTAETEEIAPKDIVAGFFEWLYQKINNKQILVNRSGNPVYVLQHDGKKIMGVVSPKTFAEYAQDTGLVETGELNNKTMLEAAKIVQSAIHKCKANVPSGSRQIHYRRSVSSQSARARLSLYFFELDQITTQDLRDFIAELPICDNLLDK